jgi:hypothetical protein
MEVPAADITPFQVNEDFGSLLVLVHVNACEVDTQLQISFPVRPVSSLAPPHCFTPLLKGSLFGRNQLMASYYQANIPS